MQTNLFILLSFFALSEASQAREWIQLSASQSSLEWEGSLDIVSENTKDAQEAYDHVLLTPKCGAVYCEKNFALSTGEIFHLRRAINFNYTSVNVTKPISKPLISIPMSKVITTHRDLDLLYLILDGGAYRMSLVNHGFNLECTRSQERACRLEVMDLGYYDTEINFSSNPSYGVRFRRWFQDSGSFMQLTLSDDDAEYVATSMGVPVKNPMSPSNPLFKEIAFSVDDKAKLRCARSPRSGVANCQLDVRDKAAAPQVKLFPERILLHHKTSLSTHVLPANFKFKSQGGMLAIQCQNTPAAFETCEIVVSTSGEAQQHSRE